MKSWSPLLILVLLSQVGCGARDRVPNTITSLERADTSSYSVPDAMELYGLQGLSVVVFEDYQIAWSKSWGVKDAKTREEVDLTTAFSTASISKPITATLFVLLEEKGLIDLDAPVSGYLKRWNLPKTEFSKTTAITLKHLLSHTAGTTQHGFDDFYEGDELPSLSQSLDGDIPGNDAIEFQTEPGTTWSYSGGGYVIAQMAMEDHLGEPLAELAREHLFGPLGLKNTTMTQPHETGFPTNAAKAHNRRGRVIDTGLPITPQVAPSGMWSTPSDMTKFMIEMQNALRSSNNSVISHDVATKVTDIVTTKGHRGWSMGWERRKGYANHEWFSHGGANTGTGGYIMATMEGGNGMVLFGNSDANNREPVLEELRNYILDTQGWHVPLDRSEEQPLPEGLTETIVGKYEDDWGYEIEIIVSNQQLFQKGLSRNLESELVYVGDNTFVLDEYSCNLKFKPNTLDNGRMSIYQQRIGTNDEHLAFQRP